MPKYVKIQHKTAKFVHFSEKNGLKKNNNSFKLICLLLFSICVD